MRELQNYADFHKPKKQDCAEVLAEALQKLGVSSDSVPEKKPQTAAKRRQTFYGAFKNAGDSKASEARKNKKGKNKKQTPVEDTFPRFDLSQDFAKLDPVTANQVFARLEQAEAPVGKACAARDEIQLKYIEINSNRVSVS